ncbi:polymer-forming cytoskeletal protein [Patescibacteria group bacterium]|nr:polymer-forming cytoskeletal protein [Patescibacteria group bacterium]
MCNKKFFACLAIVAMIMVASPAGAADFRSGEEFALGGDKTILDNLYTAGGTVLLGGKVEGDFFAAGGTILFTGEVRDDLTAAGGTVSLVGLVGGDLRAAGGTVMIGAAVGGEGVVVGGQLSVAEGATFEKDVTLAGGMVTFSGETKSGLKIYGDEAVINGKIYGNVFAKVKKLTIGPEAEITGSLFYEATKEANIDEAAVIGGMVDFKKIEIKGEERGATWAIFGGIWLSKLLSVLLIGLLLYWIFRRQTEELVKRNLKEFGWDLLRGTAIAICLPIAAIISFVTIIGGMLGMGGLLLYFFLMILSSALGGMALGSLIWKLFSKGKEFHFDWKTVVVGIVLLGLAGLIPYVGWIFGFVFALAAFGGLWVALSGMFFEKK